MKTGFAKILKEKMREKNLTLNSLSKQTGISKSSIHAYTLGSGPVLKNLIKLANFFQIPMEEFFYDSNDSTSNTSKTITVQVDANTSFEIKIKRLKCLSKEII